jgi:uncharacterized repeat protein (TIGR03803 family)
LLGVLLLLGMPGAASAQTVETVYNFDSQASPRAPVTEGNDGNLYGTTWDGGSSMQGTVFKLAKDGTGFTILQSFQQSSVDT